MREANVDGDAMLRNPTTGFVGCCAVAASGKAAAEPAIILMNSRRLIAVPASSGASSYLLRPANRKGAMSALGQKQTCAAHQLMSALPPIATAKADMRKRSCLLCPSKQTCAVHWLMSALGQKRTSSRLFAYSLIRCGPSSSCGKPTQLAQGPLPKIVNSASVVPIHGATVSPSMGCPYVAGCLFSLKTKILKPF